MRNSDNLVQKITKSAANVRQIFRNLQGKTKKPTNKCQLVTTSGGSAIMSKKS